MINAFTKQDMNIVVITNGDIYSIEKYEQILRESDYIICADGAARYLREINLPPNMLVGDFDSITLEDMEWIKSKGVILNKFQMEKDKTDTELAIDYAFAQNPKGITLIGAIGSRIDHSIGNILLLKKIVDRDISGRIIGENLEMYLIKDNLDIEGEYGDILSLIPLTNVVREVSLSGLRYSLYKKDLYLGSTIGISNEFKEKSTAIVSIKKGLLLAIKTKE